MYLNVTQSHSCALNHIRVPPTLMKALEIDYGDWLVFDTKDGPFSVMVTKTSIDDIIEHGENKAFVSEHSPILDSALKEVYIEPHKLTIGGDPEFFIVDTRGNLVEAFKVFPFDDQVGCDGDLGELRPDFALCPDQLTENIRQLMVEMNRRLPAGLVPMASSFFKHRCSGFHVHLGMPIELLSFAADDVGIFFGNLVATLDYLVAVPAAALDSDDKRRLSNSYGKPGDYRISMRTLEYRTPGGFHLRSPSYTKHLLSTAFKVVERVVHETEKISGGWRDMSEVAGLAYFKDRYGIPDSNYVRKVLTTRDRGLLDYEAERARGILSTLMEEYSGNVVEYRKQEDRPLISEWLEHEKKRQAKVHF